MSIAANLALALCRDGSDLPQQREEVNVVPGLGELPVDDPVHLHSGETDLVTSPGHPHQLPSVGSRHLVVVDDAVAVCTLIKERPVDIGKGQEEVCHHRRKRLKPLDRPHTGVVDVVLCYDLGNAILVVSVEDVEVDTPEAVVDETVDGTEETVEIVTEKTDDAAEATTEITE